MTRRMSVWMTRDAVRERRKVVTRRHVDTWTNLKAGDHLLLIEKGQGLAKGAKQVVICEVKIMRVDVRPLWPVTLPEVFAEGLWHEMKQRADAVPGVAGSVTWSFCEFWMAGHGYKPTDDPASIQCRRIEWRYLDA